jgi:hypothetical protein
VIARGAVFIGTRDAYDEFPDGAQFTNDPRIERSWPPRQTVLPGIGGTVTIQDFGRHAKDMRLTLSSAAPPGNQNWIDGKFKAYLDGLAAVRGAVYDYVDYTGVDAVVKILDFVPAATFHGNVTARLWEYTLELIVITLNELDGETYTGD